MVIVPGFVLSVFGVKTRTGNTAEPTPLEARVSEEKVGAMRMAAAGSCWNPALVPVESLRIPPTPRAVPRVKPDSVMVMAVVPVGAPPVVMTIWVLAASTIGAVPVSAPTLDAPARKAAVPMK